MELSGSRSRLRSRAADQAFRRSSSWHPHAHAPKHLFRRNGVEIRELAIELCSFENELRRWRHGLRVVVFEVRQSHECFWSGSDDVLSDKRKHVVKIGEESSSVVVREDSNVEM